MNFKLNKSMLSFSVKVANSLPETGNENNFVIVSDTLMKNWHLSPDTPTGAPRNDGDVWVRYSTLLSSINIVKNGGFWLNIEEVLQYIDGEWVEKIAYCYRNGEWFDCRAISALYYRGDECVRASGGWQARGLKRDSSTSYTYAVAPTLNKTAQCMELKPPAGDYACGVVEVCTDQDLTNINKLIIDLEGTATKCEVDFIVINRSATYISQAVRTLTIAHGSSNIQASVKNAPLTMDVSDLEGVYDIAISYINRWSGSASGTIKVYSVLKG